MPVKKEAVFKFNLPNQSKERRRKKKKQIISLTWFSLIMAVVVWTYIYSNENMQSTGSSILSDNLRQLIRKLSIRFVSKNQNQFNKFEAQNISPRIRFIQQREEELRHLSDLIQRRLFYIQNPSNCTATRKVICEPNNAGFGSGLHQVTFCLIVAYATRRTLILKSRNWTYAEEGWETLFLSVSTNCTSNIDAVLTYDIVASLESLNLRHNGFVVRLELSLCKEGRWFIISKIRLVHYIHVRRTDKIHDSRYFEVKEYMTHVEKWFEKNVKNKTHTKYVYIATDATSVIKEAKQRYPGYSFVYHEEAMNVVMKNRYSVSSLKILLSEVHNLAMCDYVVCTMSSNICRFVRELKGLREWNASSKLVSLDRDYLFHIRRLRKIKGPTSFQNMTAAEMTRLALLNKYVKKQQFQKYSVDIKKSRVVMPIYPEVTLWK